MSADTYRCDYHADGPRCTAPATHRLIADDGVSVPGIAYCEAHAQETIDEYAEKLGLHWTMQPLEVEQ